MRVGEGGNFSIDLEGGVATLRVWRRPDLSFDEGARLALVILDHIRKLAAGGDARGFIMDLREAPPLTGKRTRATLTEIVGTCEVAGKRIGILLAAGAQRVILERGLSVKGPTTARFFDGPELARTWSAASD